MQLGFVKRKCFRWFIGYSDAEHTKTEEKGMLTDLSNLTQISYVLQFVVVVTFYKAIIREK
jgi:hypothetical protein